MPPTIWGALSDTMIRLSVCLSAPAWAVGTLAAYSWLASEDVRCGPVHGQVWIHRESSCHRRGHIILFSFFAAEICSDLHFGKFK